jgi:FtsP/CotA-like multicopper oxidase with cupredoxin domain
MTHSPPTLSRRGFLRIGAGAVLAGGLAPWRLSAGGLREFQLRLEPASVQLAPPPFPATPVWAFNGTVPGPEIRIRQGERVRVRVRNGLAQETTVHWHGLRVPNRVDGVPYLTQVPIAPGEEYVYEFAPPDAGTFWYHPHVNTSEQIGRGLYGPLIVEEAEPLVVDREVTWVLDDWRLTREATIKDDFHNPTDFARAGRLGSTITVNGRAPEPFAVRSGERVRLRLINSANARIFSLRFQNHSPRIVALDGQPVEPFTPRGGAVQLAPAQRADLVLDMGGDPGSRSAVLDTFYPQAPYKLLDLAYTDERALRGSPLDAPVRLAPNPVPEPDLAESSREDVIIEGGDMGQLDAASLQGRDTSVSELFLLGKMWAINGIAGFRTVMPPLFTVPRGRTCVLHFKNLTAWPHPMHLHGHHFKVIAHDGDQSDIGTLRDTVHLGPGEHAQAAFVADNPGDWLFHCHINTHAEAGMMAVVRVT